MFPFWRSVIEPLIRAAKPRTVLEIGAFRGDTTIRLVNELEPGVELHVVDVDPQFDPAEHEAVFRGRYVFHRAPSLEVLRGLPAADLALIDGDHNWYTVYNELKLLAATAGDAGRPLPILLMHDVSWPYGRRDLYYDPARIPAEFRHKHAQLGIVPGRSKLARRGGLNSQLFNAVVEGGPRNGVATALDDFLAEQDRPFRRVVVPVYFGLAIVVEEAVLADRPEVAAVLDHIEGSEGRGTFLELAERLWAQSMTAQHTLLRANEPAPAPAGRPDAYLALLKSALLNEHYVENELRNQFLAMSAAKGRPPDRERLRDPARYLPNELGRLQATHRTGRLAGDRTGRRPYFDFYADIGRNGLEHLERCLAVVRDEEIPGDFVVGGPGPGGTGIYVRGWARAWGLQDRGVWIVDRFKASPESATVQAAGDLNAVREAFDRFGLLDEQVHFVQGRRLVKVLSVSVVESIALLHLSGALGASVTELLELLYDRISEGGFVIVHHYAEPKTVHQVEEFRRRRGIAAPLERVGATAVVWQKSEQAVVASPAPPAEAPSKDLSVIVVVFNMARAAPRTLHSLSRAYQQGVESLDYEVIVVENGSAPEEALGEDLVAGFGSEFRYLDMGAEASPTPIVALQAGLSVARGAAVALMIDGAHVLTPGVLRHGMTGLEAYHPAVVATQQWYLGPGQQPEAVDAGYDETAEDRLLEAISWPTDGYELLQIGHFVGNRDWLDAIPESNCLFATRAVLEAAGGLDDAFDLPGAGFANLDLYERIGSTPGVRLVTILGEASLHQLHGGTTTNKADSVERNELIASFRAQYEQLRGKPYQTPVKQMHYVGHMRSQDARTKARRRYSSILLKTLRGSNGDGAHLAIPQELHAEYVAAYWHSRGWKRASWLGHPIERPPGDLFAYQELVARLRPERVVVTGEGPLGLYLASICELVGAGTVIHVSAGLPSAEHPRLVHVQGDPAEPDAISSVERELGGHPAPLVFISARTGPTRLVDEFAGYARHVPVGGYVVVENTLVGDSMLGPADATAPRRAVGNILASWKQFVPDRELEGYGASFNPQGYLKRVSS